MTTCVFLGPSLRIEDARALVPEALFRPPAEQGDLLTAVVRDGADLIGLVDGTFHQNLSVWHNELCFLLAQGVTIVGASSMGALRAAETRRYGMVGIGRIFRWYRDGVITADDEVALLHREEEAGYEGVTLPLVNIRATLDQAASRGVLTREVCDTILELARAIYYAERTPTRILSSVRAALSPDDAARAVRVLSDCYIDQKSLDARELLEYVHGIADGSVPRPKPVSFEFAGSACFDTLYNLDREISRGGGPRVRLQAVVEHAALNDPSFEDRRRDSLHRDLALFLAVLLGVRPEPADVEHERDLFMASRCLEPEDMKQWLHDNDMTEHDLHVLLIEESMCRRLRLWAISARGFDRGARSLLDHMRLAGDYPLWRTRAITAETIADTYEHTPDYAFVGDVEPAVLAELYAAMTGVAITGDAGAWAEMNGFDGVGGLLGALQRNFIASDVDRRVQAIRALLCDPAPVNDAKYAEPQADRDMVQSQSDPVVASVHTGGGATAGTG